MSSDQSFVDFIIDQIHNAGTVTYKKMFGEYALYADGKVVALICDDQLFVKPTVGGRKFIEESAADDVSGNGRSGLEEAPAYKGAKPSFLIADKFEDREWLSQLIRITRDELPLPKPKKKKQSS